MTSLSAVRLAGVVLTVLIVSTISVGCVSGWRALVAARLREFGHRNWIVIADSAYPRQSNPGIETIYAGGDPVETLAAVLEAVEQAAHVRPRIYIDQELAGVPEQDAPGIERYRRRLAALIGDRPVQRLPHVEIIEKLDEAAGLYCVTIVKTGLTLPYTSAFLELECGYWNDHAEKRLREALRNDE